MGWKPVELEKAVALLFWQRFKRDRESTARKTGLFISNDPDPLSTISEHRINVLLYFAMFFRQTAVAYYHIKLNRLWFSCLV